MLLPLNPQSNSTIVTSNLPIVQQSENFAPKPPTDYSKVIRCNLSDVKARLANDPLANLLPKPKGPVSETEQIILDDDGHRDWGTGIYQSNGGIWYPGYDVLGVTALQYVRNDLDLGSGDQDRTLYAPTLKAPEPSPLEAVTVYYRQTSWSSTTRNFGIWDHSIGYWATDLTSFDTLRSNGYLYGSGNYEYYYVTIWQDQSTDTWSVDLWNFNLGYWVEFYSTTSSSQVRYDGWNMFETYGWDNQWPDLPLVQGKLLMTYRTDLSLYPEYQWTNANDYDTYVLDQFNGELSYDHDWFNNYYDWFVGDSPGYRWAGSIAWTNTYGQATVDDAGHLISYENDGDYSHLHASNYGNVARICTVLNNEATGSIQIYGYSGEGYFSRVLTYVSPDEQNWQYAGGAYIDTTTPDWVTVGYTASTTRYILVVAYDQGFSCCLYFDSLRIS